MGEGAAHTRESGGEEEGGTGWEGQRGRARSALLPTPALGIVIRIRGRNFKTSSGIKPLI